jgi:arylsulfatase A
MKSMHRLVLILSACCSVPTARAAEKPNIVFVLFDDMGWAQPQCYDPGSALRTPHLDRLARDGMRFTDAHSASGVCTPTRYGVLTGRYPWRIGQFGVLTTYSPPIIPKERLTVASLLQQHGYATACVGKWHLGLNWVDGKPGKENAVTIGARHTDGPNALGFDYFCGFTHARNIGTIIEQDRVVAHVEAVDNQPLMIRKAVEWLGKQTRDKPFFLYFPMCPPHTPIVPAEEFAGRSGARDVVKNDPKYGDWVFQGDAMLGQLLEALERGGFADNTLVIATADNGAEGRAYAPWRASKRSIYEGGHRVPFVARWPGKVKAGSVSDQTVCLNDLLATVAEIAGAKIPANAGEDSVSLLPALLGTAKSPLREGTVHQSSTGDLALRQGPWKAVFHKDGSRELFHLGEDRGETRDVIAQQEKPAQELAKLMKRYIEQGRSTPGDPQKNEFSPSLNPQEGARKAKRAGSGD